MFRSLSSVSKIKLFVILGAFILAIVTFTGLPSDLAGTYASAFGPAASHTNAPGESNCTECHNSFPVNSGPGSVYVSDLPERYVPGQQITVTVTTRQAQQIVYGFQLVILD